MTLGGSQLTSTYKKKYNRPEQQNTNTNHIKVKQNEAEQKEAGTITLSPKAWKNKQVFHNFLNKIRDTNISFKLN